MKRISKLIPAILGAGALLVLASCSDELITRENGYSQSEGTRTIAVSFGPQTRTALGDDGLTPEFVGGEMILVSNDETTQECQVTSLGEKAIITTSLKGDLTAVYPARAAKVIKSEKTGGNIIDPDNVLISTEQSGTFADANICMAKNITDAATFVNQTAILKFYVGEEIGVTSINVTSSGEDIADGSKTITVATSGGKTLYDDMPSGQDRRICYVAVKSGANANTLTFTTKTNTQGQQTKTSTVDAILATGMMYNAFIPYYVEVGDQKWGYCNIGAFLPEEPGEYFAWGEIKGHKADFSISPDDDGHIPGAFASDFKAFDHSDVRYTGTYNHSAGFAFCNTPYYNDTSFDKYTGSDGYTLLLEDDAANANWGNNWRMPTSQDFQNLYGACAINGYGITTYAGTERGEVPTFGKGVYWCGNYDGVAGCLFCDGTKNLFFPAVGCGSGTKLIDVGKYVRYWSSTNEGLSNYYAYRLDISDRDIDLQLYGNRFDGNSVRPIYDCSIPDGALPGVFSVGKGADGIEGTKDDKKICFSKGNLQAKYSKASGSYSWQFAAEQYQHVVNAPGNTTIDSQSDGALVDLFSWSTSNTNYGITNSKTENFFSGDFLDWGIAYCEANNVTPNTTWRTMSVEEWQYLFNHGSYANKTRNGLYAKGITVMGQTNCVVLYPDGYNGTKVTDNDKTTYKTAESWEAAQNAGVVCLPPTSNRNGSTVWSVYNNDRLCYWTSSKINDTELYALIVQYSNKVFNFEKINGVDGRSVRLVTNVK